MMTKAWRLISVEQHEALLCLICDRYSFIWKDIQNHFCGFCHTWLDDVAPDYVRPAEQSALTRKELLLQAWPHPFVRLEDQCLNRVGDMVRFINPVCKKPNCTGDHK